MNFDLRTLVVAAVVSVVAYIIANGVCKVFKIEIPKMLLLFLAVVLFLLILFGKIVTGL